MKNHNKINNLCILPRQSTKKKKNQGQLIIFRKNIKFYYIGRLFDAQFFVRIISVI